MWLLIECFFRVQAEGYFRADYSGESPSLAALDSPQFTNLISYYPVKDVITLQTLHRHYSNLATSIVKNPPKSFQPSNINDYLSWHYFDETNLFDDKSVMPSSNLQQYRHMGNELQVCAGSVLL